MTRLKRLRAGSRLAVVSPASIPKGPLVQLGMQRLRDLGYQPVLMPSALAKGPLNYAGTADARAADLHAAFADPAYDGILCTRGGWGAAELLPLLDTDLIRANPKPFLGFSDMTTLHLLLAQVCGVHSFYAPMVAPDFARGDTLAHGVDLYSWRSALEQAEPWHLDAAQGMRVLKAAPDVEGTLIGGCLTLLTESLSTPWAMQPPPGDLVLFLEEVGTAAYQWDRMLLHLRYAGLLERVRGIVFGDMEQCCTGDGHAELIEETLRYNLRDFAGPVSIGLLSGHVNAANVALPLGVRVRLSCTSAASLHFLESAVE